MAVAVGALVLGAAGCKGSTSAAGSATPTTSASVSASASAGPCQKVRFTAHAGLGVGAVHRYLYKPFQAGTFKSGASGRKTAIVKGALAGAFAEHEFRSALSDVSGCPELGKVDTALTAIETKASALVTNLKSGHFSTADLGGISSQADSLVSTAKSSGLSVDEKDPSALQLATG
jgi:hypothetical protein